MTAIDAMVAALVSASLFGSAWAVGAALVSASRARNGQAQITNFSLKAMSELLNDALMHRAQDQGRIETLIGVISRGAARLREAGGRHAEAHAASNMNCPFYEQYQNSVELVVIYLEQAIEPERNGKS